MQWNANHFFKNNNRVQVLFLVFSELSAHMTSSHCSYFHLKSLFCFWQNRIGGNNTSAFTLFNNTLNLSHNHINITKVLSPILPVNLEEPYSLIHFWQGHVYLIH